jgi:hypothetical protein
MSIDLYMEDEEGASQGEVLDPDDLTGRIVALGGHQGTVCLRFVDPCGNTIFNQFQTPTLIRELEAARGHVTEERLATLGQCELESAREAKWTPTVIHAIEVQNQRVRLEDVREHLERLLELAGRARGKAHTYLKFYGD